MDNIKKSQIIAGENAVIENLKNKGLLPNDEKGSQQSLLFFNLFRQVREEVSGENGYCLEDAIRKTFDRWLLNDESIKSDSEMLDWIQKMMTPKDNYCEIFFAGLRNGDNDAESFQIESNPQIFETSSGKTLREAITKVMTDSHCI